ncbi:hypothetical protein C1645_818575 [Glomus cerebriforme]|uniref:Tetraspanin family-domain-containing protein n=1 Tax=Glomus cerebriforme TaxID=658196 RepID=A0A397T7B7_9GLOM|nr:hypothetical protein C1645_818575 [Glomus cerebriforme]
MAIKITKYCFYMPLKTSVIIVSSLWLIQGIIIIIKTIEFSLDLNLSDQEIAFKQTYTLPIFIIYGIMIIGSLFGLLVVNCANTSKMLFLYSKVAYVILGSNILGINILTIAEIVLHGSIILKECGNLSHICNYEYYHTRTISMRCLDLSYVCNQKYYDITYYIISYAITFILLSVYSVMVISAYAHKKKDKEDVVRHGYQNVKKDAMVDNY